MSKVDIKVFEIIGPALTETESYYTEKREAKEAHWAYVKQVGGVGYRPSHHGHIDTVFFHADSVPTGWRRVKARQGVERGHAECRPNLATKAGKIAGQQLGEQPVIPSASDLGKLLGYNPNSWAIDGITIYFPTELTVTFPVTRKFLRLPCFDGDGFVPDPTRLLALRKWEFEKAVEEHNEEARRQELAAAGQAS